MADDVWEDKRSSRPVRETLPVDRPTAFFVEEEPAAPGQVTTVATLFLVNRECPFECVYCDLWRHTTPDTVPVGAVPRQIETALSQMSPAREIKLYNSGNFFDPRAIVPEDHATIARLCAGFERVIVENHPRLCGWRCVEFRDLVLAERRKRQTGRPEDGILEIAMGLETVHPDSWSRLNKQMTPTDFQRASRQMVREGISVRAFVMLQPPFVAPDESVASALETVEFAWESGARMVAVIPTRATTPAVRQWEMQGVFREPQIGQLESVFEEALSRKRGIVTVDTWDLDRFCPCDACGPRRKSRLHAMNLSQRILPPVSCSVCG
ncbi:MAG: radical SAM protein [Planctomycetaceae bacterium]